MKEVIRQRALQLGFDDCRFTDAAPPESASHFEQWLASGQHGEMGYLERNAPKRVDPLKVLPEAKSIVSLAVSYDDQRGIKDERDERLAPNLDEGTNTSPPAPRSSPLGKIARYARYQDYHDVLGERLKRLAEFMNELGGPGTTSFLCVDTGPLLERDLAQRAGLGFIGKHTNVISRKLGNWIFLCEIITTLELEPDKPGKNLCGTCSRCISACPTGAITAPFVLDARLCISYLTIELKGPIPAELRPAIGDRIFGCDDCLAVCPWNRFAREGNIMKAHSRPDVTSSDLLELLDLDEAGFRRRFGDTPISRAKRRGLLRNVCVAIGNVGDASALPALQKAATDPEPLIAEHARWAIERIRARTPE